MKSKSVLYFFFGIILSLVITSCSQNTEKYTDTPTSGSISIGIDETFEPIIASELDVFSCIYNYSSITPHYKPEIQLFDELMKDSVRLIITSRQLTSQEIDFFKNKKFFPKETKIATDAIALIVNNKNLDTNITLENIKKIFTGKLNSWKQLNPNSSLGNFQLVFDNTNSSTVRFFFDSICKNENPAKNVSALNNNRDVIRYVSQNPNAIGIIGVSWISNKNDTTTLSFLKDVKVMGISMEATATTDNSYQPYQAYIAMGKYPLTRSIYMINSDPRVGLASGFASFLASDRGQRIILKSGILPATQPVRIVHINDNF